MEFDCAKIVKILQTLRDAKSTPNAFGADAHLFRVHRALSEQEVSDFESRYRIQLPAEYRDFLIRVGNGGAGPAYGLFKLGEVDDAFSHKPWKENDGFIGKLAEPFPHHSTWNELAGRPEEEPRESDPAWEEEFERRMEAWENAYWNPSNVNGAIPICHLGCAQRRWLVVSGAEKGNVWEDYRADLGGLQQLQQNSRERVTFGQWYCDWLEEVLRQ